MRVFNSEFVHSYPDYSFGYTTYAQKKPGDQLADIYQRGFLPFTGAKGVLDHFYLARSSRIRLKKWQLNSENRRVRKKFKRLVSALIPLSSFDYQNKKFQDFCLEYFEKRHGPGIMPRERLLQILGSGLITHVAEYKLDGKLLAYVLIIQDANIRHFLFSFYDLHFIYQSLGLWLMIDQALAAQAEGKKYLYLGTAYGKKGLYKTNFDQLEYWDGERWVADTTRLRERCNTDETREINRKDSWKEQFQLF